MGTISTTSIEPVEEIVKINKKYIYVDATYAGTAAILPELRYILELVVLVINPHKWLFVPIDLSVFKPNLFKTSFLSCA